MTDDIRIRALANEMKRTLARAAEIEHSDPQEFNRLLGNFDMLRYSTERILNENTHREALVRLILLPDAELRAIAEGQPTA